MCLVFWSYFLLSAAIPGLEKLDLATYFFLPGRFSLQSGLGLLINNQNTN